MAENPEVTILEALAKMMATSERVALDVARHYLRVMASFFGIYGTDEEIYEQFRWFAHDAGYTDWDGPTE